MKWLRPLGLCLSGLILPLQAWGRSPTAPARDVLERHDPRLGGTRQHAATWSPDLMRYDPVDMQPALTELLQVPPAIRSSETYQYDLVDVAL